MAKEKEKLVVKVEESFLTIRIPRQKPPKLSKSQKSFVVATTQGNVPTEAVVNGKVLIVGVNAYIKKD